MSINSNNVDPRREMVLEGYELYFDPHSMEENIQARNAIVRVLFLLLEQSENIEWKNEDIHPDVLAYNLEKIYRFFDWMS